MGSCDATAKLELYIDATPDGRLIGYDYHRSNFFELQMDGERIILASVRPTHWAALHQSILETAREVCQRLAVENRLENSWVADLCRCAEANVRQ